MTWSDGIAPTEITLDCGGEKHRLRWADGILSTPDHADPDGERALAALGGEPIRCIRILDVWLRHTDDLDVLVLGSRGPADQLAKLEDHGAGGSGMSFVGSGVGANRPAKSGWTFYVPLGGSAAVEQPDDDVASLLGLGGGLPLRLAAGVAATWAERLNGPELPTLHAALYGRAVAAIRAWLGDRAASIDFVMCEHGQASVFRADGALAVQLPFSWLSEVWARGLTTVMGRFCLSAEQTSPATWTLLTVSGDLTEPQPLVIHVT